MSCCKNNLWLSFLLRNVVAHKTLRHYAFSRQQRTQFSEDVYAFVLWRYVAVQIWRAKELFLVLSRVLLSWIPLLASVEIAPFGELYKFDQKTGKMVADSIPLHTSFYQTLFTRLQTTFLVETSCQNDTYWVNSEDQMEFTGLRQGFHN